MSIENKISTIRSLLNKTVSNGATEEEAYAAFKHAKILMEKYSITMEDIKKKTVKAEDYGYVFVNKTKYVNTFDKLICHHIAMYTNTISHMVSIGYGDNKVFFFGHRVDVELAVYIRKICHDTLNFEWGMFKKSFISTNGDCKVNKHKISFAVGMADRICERIDSLIADEYKAGNQLIVLKNQIVAQMFDSFSQGYTKKNSIVNYNKYNISNEAGYNSGDKVEFHKKASKQMQLEYKK